MFDGKSLLADCEQKNALSGLIDHLERDCLDSYASDDRYGVIDFPDNRSLLQSFNSVGKNFHVDTFK